MQSGTLYGYFHCRMIHIIWQMWLIVADKLKICLTNILAFSGFAYGHIYI